MSRPPSWKILIIVAVAAGTATIVYTLRQHNPGVHTGNAAATHARSVTSPSPTSAIVKLTQSFVADPPYGSGFITHGTYLQVSGVNGLEAVNAALRQLIVDDQAQDRSNLAQPATGTTTPPGEYGSGPSEPPAISASSGVVSVLLKTEVVPPDGQSYDSWVSATLLVPSAHPVQLISLFKEPRSGMAAVAAAAKDYLIANVPCAARALKDPTVGDTFAGGLNPAAPENYKHFAITPNGLIIGFAQEQVGPHSCGSFTATVGWTTLKPILSPVGALLLNQLR
jgi:hypothetical protein